MDSNNFYPVPDWKTSQDLTESYLKSGDPVNLAVANTLKFYFDIFYILCIIPFRIKWNVTTKNFSVSTFLPQKLLCLITLASSHVWIFLWLRFDYPTNKSSPVGVFIFLETLFLAILRLSIFQVLWLRKFEIENFLNYIVRMKFSITTSRAQNAFFNWATQLQLLIIKFALAIMGLATHVFPSSFNLSKFTVGSWMMQMLRQTRVALFISVSNGSSQAHEVGNDMQCWTRNDYVVFLFGAISSFYCQINLYVPDYYLYLVTAVMWSAASSFSRYIKNPKSNCWKNLSRIYKVMYILAGHTNQTLGFVPLWWFVSAAFYFSFKLNTLFLDLRSPKNINVHKAVFSMSWLVPDVLFAFFVVKFVPR